jgi:hypothetical protein
LVDEWRVAELALKMQEISGNREVERGREIRGGRRAISQRQRQE